MDFNQFFTLFQHFQSQRKQQLESPLKLGRRKVSVQTVLKMLHV